LVHWTADYLV